MNVLAANSPASPYVSDLLFAQFQSQFAAVTVAILLGAVAERARVFPTIILSFVWTTIVYCPMVLPPRGLANFRRTGFGIQQVGHTNGVFLTSLEAALLKSPAALELLHTPFVSAPARTLILKSKSKRTDLTVFPMSC
jgi:hypothetical protein